jgi:hypothetical protein
MKSATTLRFSAKLWFIIATLGQWLFAFYIVAFYGKNTVTGQFEKWNEVLPHGYVKGDWAGNLLVGVHVMLAIVMVVGGPLQFIPQIRNRFKTFHRWLGRIYVLTAIIMALDGFVMVWTRGTVGGTLQHICISIQAIYIVIFALLVITFARKKEFLTHQQWAWRLFMVCNGVWFFRVGLMAWLLIHQAPVGFNPDTFDGPFLWFLAVFTYAIPLSLLIFELYQKAHKSQNNGFRWSVASLIFLLTILMTVGIVGATMGMWMPRIF